MNNSFNTFCEKKNMKCNHVCIHIYDETNKNNHMNTLNHTSSYSLPAPSLASKPSNTSMIIQDIKDTSLYTSISSLWS